MVIIKKVNDLTKFINLYAGGGRDAGFVPTMGALHKGHLSLINTAKQKDKLTITSIFVNPAQFNDPNDYEKYPVTIEKDILLLEQAGCDVLFLPSVNEIYPEGTAKTGTYNLGYLETILEGKFRPGHFQGVCMVMDRLLTIVKPQHLYLGRKDYQQCMVIKRLTELTGLDKIVNVEICPTLREEDGLAMSSRNMRLSPEERKKAVIIYKTLSYLEENLQPGSLAAIKAAANKILTGNGFNPDYVEIASADDLRLLNEWDGTQKIVALIAAFLDEVRLIDNMALN